MSNATSLRYIRAFAPAITWAGLIFFLSAQEVLPGLTLSIPDFLLKKTAHIIVFAVLYILVLQGFANIGHASKHAWRQAMIVCLSYAILDELHQTTVPGRTGTFRDVMFDFIGISLAFLRKFRYI